MKKLLLLLIIISTFTFAQAQNNMEAKMAYQMAEEKFEAKQYTEALDYLKKAKDALGNTNPPMAYLRVIIVDQIVFAKESTEVFNNLEKVIADFEETENKEALGEEKLMDVYRIKMGFDKRKATFEKKANKNSTIKMDYTEMVYRLSSNFPKTKTPVSNFITNLPKSWMQPWDNRLSGKSYEKQIKRIILSGQHDFYYQTIGSKQFVLSSLKTYNKELDSIQKYNVLQLINDDSKSKIGTRGVTIEEICEILKITKKMWEDVTTGDYPLIKIDKHSYKIIYTAPEKGKKNMSNNISFSILNETVDYGSKYRDYIFMIINENTL